MSDDIEQIRDIMQDMVLLFDTKNCSSADCVNAMLNLVVIAYTHTPLSKENLLDDISIIWDSLVKKEKK